MSTNTQNPLNTVATGSNAANTVGVMDPTQAGNQHLANPHIPNILNLTMNPNGLPLNPNGPPLNPSGPALNPSGPALNPNGPPANPNGSLTNQNSASTPASMAALSARMDHMTQMMNQLMTMMVANATGPVPNLNGLPSPRSAAQSAPVAANQPPQPQQQGNQQTSQLGNQQAPQQQPPNAQLGSTQANLGFNNAPASISQMIQHPPPSPSHMGVVMPQQHLTPHGVPANSPLTRTVNQVSGGAALNFNLPPAHPAPNRLHIATQQPLQAALTSQALPTFPPRNATQYGGTDTEGAASVRSGRSQLRRRAEGRRRNLRDPSTEDDSSTYEQNRENPETRNCKEIKIEKFSPENKEQDFPIWISQFEEATDRCLNPHSQRRHYIACLKWLPSVLKTDAYSIWSRSANRTDWVQLKLELEAAFEDGSIRSEWKTNMMAYMWDEHGQSLQSYCAKVKRLVDSFETEMADCPKAKKAQYYLRFINGLPKDYKEHIRLGLSSDFNNVDKARDVCIQFQTCKRIREKEKTDVGASVSFQDPTAPSRITKNETDIIRLCNELKHIKETKSGDSQPRHHQGGSSSAGRSPYRQPNNSGSSRDNSKSRMEDRFSRFRQRDGGDRFRNNNHRGRQGGNSHSTSSSRPSAPAETAAVMAAASTEVGICDDTLVDWAQFKELEAEEEFARFCSARDNLDSGNY